MGLQWCIENGYKEIQVESDSLILINAINIETGVPWQIAHLLEQILELKQEGNFSFSRCFREANSTSDQLAYI